MSIEINEDLVALAKLQNYVENCDSIERAKKICRSFLAKYDPDPLLDMSPVSLGIKNKQNISVDRKILVDRLHPGEKNIERFTASSTFGLEILSKLSPSEQSNWKKAKLTDMMWGMTGEIYDKGFFTFNSIKKMDTYEVVMQLDLEVAKPDKIVKYPSMMQGRN